jgi:hypothetical protein
MHFKDSTNLLASFLDGTSMAGLALKKPFGCEQRQSSPPAARGGVP